MGKRPVSGEVLYNHSEGVVIFMRRVYERLDALGG